LRLRSETIGSGKNAWESAGDIARRSERLAEVGGEEGEIVEVHRVVVVEVALAEHAAGLAEVGSEEGEIVEVDRAIARAGAAINDLRHLHVPPGSRRSRRNDRAD